ncbi:hypothetical protein H0H93_008740 [Arthromyces matolae]|nr:hypothetical protein H0H93_008740 [Arthromyces matolae]
MKYPTALVVAVLTSSAIAAAVDFDKHLLKPRALSHAEDVGSYSSNSPSTASLSADVDVYTNFTRTTSRLQTRDEDEHGSELPTKKKKKTNLKKAFGHLEKSVESAALRRDANQQAAESLKAACGQLLRFNLKGCRERLGQAWKFAEDDAYHQRDCYHHIKEGAGYVLKALAEDDCPPPGSSASQTTTSSSSPDSQGDTQPSRRRRQRRGRDRTPKPSMQNDDGYVSAQSLPPPPIGTQTGLGSPPTSNPSEDNIHQRRHYEEEEITFREVASDIRRRHVSGETLSTRAVKIEELD